MMYFPRGHDKTVPTLPGLKTEAYFRERQARGDLAAFDAWIAASPEVPPLPGDGLP